MPPQSRTTQGFAGVAVEIDLILKGIKTSACVRVVAAVRPKVEIDLILKGIKTIRKNLRFRLAFLCVEIDLILKGIKTISRRSVSIPAIPMWK